MKKLLLAIAVFYAYGCNAPSKEDNKANIQSANNYDSVYLIAKSNIDKADSIIKTSIDGKLNNKKADKLASAHIQIAKAIRDTMPESYKNLIESDLQNQANDIVDYMVDKQKSN